MWACVSLGRTPPPVFVTPRAAQPCHISNASIIFFALSRGPAATVVFNMYLHLQYGAYLALATPDTRDLRFFGEVFCFYFQHTMLVAAPLYFIARRRFDMWAPRPLHAHLIATAFHFSVLQASAAAHLHVWPPRRPCCFPCVGACLRLPCIHER